MAIVDETKTALGDSYEEVVKIPSGVMNLIRQSYDSRERVLDWMLALSVAGALIYVFRAQISGMITPPKDPNAGKTDMVPNQDVKNAVCDSNMRPPKANIYTYNMPRSRSEIASRIGPSSVRIPFNPAFGGQYSALDNSED